MTHRLAQILLFVAVLGGCFLAAVPLAAQDSTQPDTPKSSTVKSKRPSTPTATGESAKDEDAATKTTDADKPQAEKADTPPSTTNEGKKEEGKADEKKNAEAKKKDDALPAVESPKLIEVPQDGTTYTPRPKAIVVFVFTNGNRIETSEYLITRDAVFITKDGQKTRYPINSVDRAATKAANEGRGVEIVFPKSKSEFNLDF